MITMNEELNTKANAIAKVLEDFDVEVKLIDDASEPSKTSDTLADMVMEIATLRVQLDTARADERKRIREALRLHAAQYQSHLGNGETAYMEHVLGAIGLTEEGDTDGIPISENNPVSP